MRTVTGMADCQHCKYAIMDYEEYYGTTLKEWFVTGCEKCRVVDQTDCPEFEEWEDRDG